MAERKGKKLRRCNKYANHYKLQFGLTDRNKKRRLIRHLRSNPNDVQGRERFAANMGDPKGIGLNSKGRKLAARA